MIIKRILINIAYKYKETLLKLFPKNFLKKIKKILINTSYEELKAFKKQPIRIRDGNKGIYLIGSIKADTGLGQSCRLIAEILKESKFKFSIYNYNQISNVKQTNESWDDRIDNEKSSYLINLIHLNPSEFLAFAVKTQFSIFKGKYNIGYWLWEMEEVPDEWIHCQNVLNEIWTPAEFISRALRKKFSIPVKTVPYSINVETDPKYSRNFFKLPENKFLFLMMYDKNSVTERKNPNAVISAFKKAFFKKENVGLIIKVGSANEQDIRELKSKFEEKENIFFITDSLTKIQVNSLINDSDVIVSLHRAEGFGLVLAEAMYLGKPTIATKWSSNIEFMTEEDSCLVDCTLKKLDKNVGPYKKGWHWADPNIEDATNFMKKLYFDHDFYKTISKNAYANIRKKLNLKTSCEIVKKRINEILETNTNSKNTL